jgi:hypothetical protein
MKPISLGGSFTLANIACRKPNGLWRYATGRSASMGTAARSRQRRQSSA